MVAFSKEHAVPPDLTPEQAVALTIVCAGIHKVAASLCTNPEFNEQVRVLTAANYILSTWLPSSLDKTE